MALRFPPLASMIVLLIAAACDGGAPFLAGGGVQRTDSAGIEIALNAGGDRLLEWTFEPVVRLGGAETGPEAFYLLHEWLVDTDATGRIYVLDPVNARVVVFDSAGAHQRSFGRRGDGPGEMTEPVALSVDSNGTINVADFARNALLRWDSAGMPLTGGESLRPLPLTQKAFAVSGGRTLAVVEASAGVADTVSWRLLRIGHDGVVPLAGALRPRTVPVDIGCAMGLIPPLFSPDVIWEARDGQVAVAVGGEYEIRLLTGDTQTRIRRALPVRRISRELALQEAGSGVFPAGFHEMECTTPAELRLDRQGFHPVLPAIADLEIGWDGSIWARRGAIRGEPRSTDIFLPDGTYLGTLPSDAPFPVAMLPGGKLVAVERDEMDIERLVVYRVRQDGV